MAILGQAAPVHARTAHQCTRPGCCSGATSEPRKPSRSGPVLDVSGIDRALSEALLGTYSVTLTPVFNRIKDLAKKHPDFARRRALSFLLDVLKSLLPAGERPPGFSAHGCRLWMLFNFGFVAPHNATADTVFIDGRFFCRTAHCSYCAAYKAALFRRYLNTEAFPLMLANGLTGDLVTLTLPHYYNDDWRAVVATLRDAFTTWYHALKVRTLPDYGVIGYFKALEAPVGVNGLHPHFHLLFVRSARTSSLRVADLAERMRSLWMDTLKKHGLQGNHHAFDFKPNCVNDYLALFDSGEETKGREAQKKQKAMSYELAAHDTKTARRSGRTSVQLLDAFISGDRKAGVEFLRWSHALHRARRFVMSDFSAIGMRSFAEFAADDLNNPDSPANSRKAQFDALPDDKKITLNVPQDVVNLLGNSPVRLYYPLVLDYGKRLCRGLTADNKPERLRLWQAFFDRCVSEHRRYIGLRRYLRMPHAEASQFLEVVSTRPLLPSEVSAYYAASLIVHARPSEALKVSALLYYSPPVDRSSAFSVGALND